MKPENKVYHRVLDLAQPLQLEEPWERLKVPASIRRQSMEPVELLPLLQAEFSAEELLASGACRTSPDGEGAGLALHPGLAGQGKRFLALCTDEAPRPFDLLTDCGCVSGALPSVTTLGDVTCRGKDDASLLLITSSIDDLIPLVSLGLAATTAFGLAELGGRSLQQFCTTFHFDRRLAPQAGGNQSSAACSAKAAPPDLVLVGWQPATWTAAVPAGMAAVVAHFTKLASYQGVELHEIAQWQPTADDLERLTFVKNYGSRQELCQLFLNLADDAPQILNYETPVLQVETLANVRARLERMSSTEHNRRDYEETVKLLELAVERELVAPLQEQLAATSDARRRLQLHGLIVTGRIVLKELYLIEASLARKSRSLTPVESKLATMKTLVSMYDRLRLSSSEPR